MTNQLPGTFQRAVAFLLVFCPALAANGGDLYSVHGLYLGERIDAVLNDPEFDCGGVSGCFLYTVCAHKHPGKQVLDDEIPIDTLALHYTGERLTAIEVRFSAQRFEEVAESLKRLHGAQYSGATQAGGNAVYEWRKGREVLRLERVLRGGIASSLILSDRSFLSELLEP